MRLQSCVNALASAGLAGAIKVDLTNMDSVRTAASTIAFDMMTYYTGNISGAFNIPGILPQPPAGYYWWEAGAMWGTLMDYWFITGDTSYNAVVTEGMLFQTGPDNDYMPPNQTKSLGNDDQAFWGMAAMTAAELRFPNPPDKSPQWLELAQAVFNTQANRWDDKKCGGGLKWQIFSFNNGYNYKNSISNGCFLNLGARLARYTDNSTYSDWAEKTWNWVTSIGLIDADYNVFDGTDDTTNCATLNHVQYSYNAGVYLLGAAAMYNYTNSDIWKTRTQGLLDAALRVFTDEKTGIMVEVACELNQPVNCNTDMLSFKAYLSRWMAQTTKFAPFTTPKIMTALALSGNAAAAQCSGGDNGRKCGLMWSKGDVWDGSQGVGQQMAALEVIISNQIEAVGPPVTNSTGGISKGNPNAGSGSAGTAADLNAHPTTAVDRAGAGVLTVLVLVGMFGGCAWLFVE